MDSIPQSYASNEMNNKWIVVGANGVGGEKLEILKKMLNCMDIEIGNAGKEVLKEGMGVDYVQKEKVVSCEIGPADFEIKCASLDGDADRLVYFTVSSNNDKKIELVDGDRILSLFALLIKEQISIFGGPKDESYRPCLGVVQTAYAKGASTDYLKQLGLEAASNTTGVKYLHEKAAEYDIGIYFEANGHGTVLFSEQFLSWLEGRSNGLSSISNGSEQEKAALRLLSVSKLINQAVGDAFSGGYLATDEMVNPWME